jgi:hypothetical protein
MSINELCSFRFVSLNHIFIVILLLTLLYVRYQEYVIIL